MPSQKEETPQVTKKLLRFAKKVDKYIDWYSVEILVVLGVLAVIVDAMILWRVW